MIVYEVLDTCSISYTNGGEDHGGFVLYKGDFFFIEPDFAWVKYEFRSDDYIKCDLLVKIYHNKLLCFGDRPEDSVYEWTWINNINLFDPKIKKHRVYESSIASPWLGAPTIKDVTKQWERENKLNLIIAD